MAKTKKKVSKAKVASAPKTPAKKPLPKVAPAKASVGKAVPLAKPMKTVEAKKPSKAKAGLPPKEIRRVEVEVIHDDQEDSQTIVEAHADEEAYQEREPEELSGDTESDADTPALEAPSTGGKALATTDPVAMYLAEIRKYPLLNREQEVELAKKYYETKDPVAAQALVTANLRFVVKVAAEYSRFGARMIDLIQEGNMGLMHGVREFNPYKGVRLITYAVWWIRGYIQEYLMKQYSLVKIGTTQNQKKLFYQLQRQKAELDAMGKSPDIKMLSSRLGIPEDEVAMMAQRMSGRDVSLDRPVDDESGSSLMDFQKVDTHSPDEDLAIKEELTHLTDAINELRPQLSEREKIILAERILADEPLTLQEIGEKYGITREAVRQMEARLMKKIKDQYTKS
jgi:RNA polymerase sigma-32 factor